MIRLVQQLLLGQVKGIQKSLHGCFAVAVSPDMGRILVMVIPSIHAGRVETFQCNDLGLRLNKSVLGNTGLQSHPAPLKDLKTVALPDTPDAGSRNENALLAEFITSPGLAIGRKPECNLYERLLHVWIYPFLWNRLSAADLLECLLSTSVIELLDTVETGTYPSTCRAGLGCLIVLLITAGQHEI